MAFNDALLKSVYNDKDAARYANQAGTPKKDDYLTAGPGQYILEVLKYKVGVSEGNKHFGKSYVAIEFEVREASAMTDYSGVEHEPTYKTGDKVSVVKYMSGRVDIKETLEFTGAIAGFPPALAIPEGKPHAGKMLPLVTDDTVESMSEDDGAAVVGSLIACTVVPNEGKGKHKGKTFHNPRVTPCDDDGNPAVWPAWEFIEDKGVDLDEMILAMYGAE